MEAKLILRYTPEKQDYIRASRALAFKSAWFINLAVVIVVVMAGSGLILASPGIGGEILRNVALVLFVLSLVYMVYFAIAIPIQLGKAYEKREHLRQERVMTFGEDHLHMQIGEGHVDLPYQDLRRIVVGKRYYLLIFEGERKVFPFIPTRGLDEAERQAFMAFFQSKSIPFR